MALEFRGHPTVADHIRSKSLYKHIDYVRGVLENMIACKKHHGDAWVSIGTTGKGFAPHYRVAPDANYIEAAGNRNVSPYFAAYDGRNHRKLKCGKSELRSDNWSASAMNYDEVRDLLGMLRAYQPKRT